LKFWIKIAAESVADSQLMSFENGPLEIIFFAFFSIWFCIEIYNF
jgi:hypothetical protein